MCVRSALQGRCYALCCTIVLFFFYPIVAYALLTAPKGPGATEHACAMGVLRKSQYCVCDWMSNWGQYEEEGGGRLWLS